MVTRLNRPLEIRGASQYPSYQQTNITFSLPAGKKFGITKRVKVGNTLLTPTQIFARGVSRMRVDADPDVNNGNVAYDKVWVTGRVAAVNGFKGEATGVYSNNSFANGASDTLNMNFPANVNDILSDTYRGIRGAGNYNGLSINFSIPNNNTVRVQFTNNSGGTLDLSNVTFFIYVFRSVDEIAQNFYNFGVRKGTAVFSEFVENGIPGDKCEQIYAKLYQIMQQNEGVTDVNETAIFADYFDANYGYSTDVSFLSSGETEATLEAKLANEAAARGNSKYYLNQAYNYRHRRSLGYYDGIRLLHGGSFIYQTIFNLERNFMAMANRKVAGFGWGALEGVDGYIEARATQQRLRFPANGSQPAGDLIRTVRPVGSFILNEITAFLFFLLGNEYEMWDDGVKYGTDLNCFGLSHIGGADPNKDKWQAIGQSIVAYQPGNNNQPQPVCSPDQAPWSDGAAPAHNAAYSAAWKYSQIYNRLNQSLKYATFNYNDNGTLKNGYFNGTVPHSLGTLNDASLNYYNHANPGQRVVVKQWTNSLPIVIEGKGDAGSVLIIVHPSARLTGAKQYNVNTQHYGLQQVNHVGPSLGIYLVN